MTEHIDRRSRSLWMDVDVAPNARELEKDQSCDTVVIGAGMAGISTAYELASGGQKVVVVDRGAIAGGITARTSAHLAPLCDDLTSAMIKLRGENIARAFYESQAAAVDRIETIQKTEEIACDFRRLDGYLFQALNTASDVIDRSSTPSARSARRSTGSSASRHWRIVRTSMRCVIRDRRPFIPSNI